ncbi:DctP family TRAP transporter solute-binding subunit [Bacillus marinisedimentorum]|uniref:DctP family TRAP transporter solute-binding subunit n=1 Tax=Bacillus marinisedimentorum TaxID=1821260 RepID=UPI0007E1620F|nr:DctP family TRAP transporter solute-binding subunit [Bacillus marinisedimentorum]
MRTVLTISIFIIAGLFTALFIGFDIQGGRAPLAADDEQEGLDDQIVLRFSHVAAENTPKGQAVRRFASLVQERTDGKVKVEVYANGVLYGDINEYKAVQDGHVEMIAPATSKLTSRFPNWQVLDLPFLFPNYAAVEEAYKGPIGQQLMADLEGEPVKGLTFWYSGFKQVTNDKRPISHPYDFKRLHFRIMPSAVIKEQFDQLNASTSVIPFNKTYRNLEVNFIDGQENTISNIYTKRFYLEQQYLTMSNHGYLGSVVLINEEFWDSLPQDIQEQIQASLDETTDWVWRHSIEMNDRYIRALKRNSDMEIHVLTNAERSRWQNALQPVYNRFEQEIDSELMEEVYQLRKKYMK